MVWWIVDDEQYRGRTTSRGEVFLWWCVDELSSDQILLGSRSDSILPFLWWLALFIEALVLFPNIEREGSQQRPF